MSRNVVPPDLNACIAEASDRARATSAKHSIVTRLDPALPAVRGDSDRLFQVVSNLLSNAVKYSPAGGEILVTTHGVGWAVPGDVRDRGLGIAPVLVTKRFGRSAR